jgi:hypothetical protein
LTKLQLHDIIISSRKEVVQVDENDEELLRFLTAFLEFLVVSLTLWKTLKPKKPKKKKQKRNKK